MDKTVTYKKVLRDIEEMEKILNDSVISQFSFSTETIKKEATKIYIEKTEKRIEELTDKSIERFFRG
tara:strand:+ start:785 stop:985 length:201 start_codon:yes stop_codon:yes gene_type:complete